MKAIDHDGLRGPQVNPRSDGKQRSAQPIVPRGSGMWLHLPPMSRVRCGPPLRPRIALRLVFMQSPASLIVSRLLRLRADGSTAARSGIPRHAQATLLISTLVACSQAPLWPSVVAAQTAPNSPAAAQAEHAPAEAPQRAPAPAHREADLHEHGLLGDSHYRSPGLAVALSLTPLPVDFGNLYAENLAWGVTYTGLELALMVPMMWLAGRHMGHDGNADRWSSGEKAFFIGNIAAYVVVKLIAGLHAGSAARSFNAAHANSGSGLTTRMAALEDTGVRF
jgi:hypothetical protein